MRPGNRPGEFQKGEKLALKLSPLKSPEMMLHRLEGNLGSVLV